MTSSEINSPPDAVGAWPYGRSISFATHIDSHHIPKVVPPCNAAELLFFRVGLVGGIGKLFTA